MISMGLTPDTVCFNTIINAHVQSGGKDNAEVPLQLVDQMRSYGVETSSVTYSIVVQARECGNPVSFDPVSAPRMACLTGN